MHATKNSTLTYVSVPSSDEDIVPNVHFELVHKKLDLENTPLGGGVLIKTLVLSSDPYHRYRFGNSPEYSLLVPPVQLGFPVDSAGIGKVLRSEDPCFKPGDIIIGYLDFAEYCIYPGKGPHWYKLPMQKLRAHPELPYSAYLGALGTPGHTAYCAWKLYVTEKIKSAETIYVSAGASTVGTFVIEYTRLKAPHVKIIASAGTDDKVEFMRQSGASVPFNYRDEDIEVMLRKHRPIDIYWDNVGGRTLDAALLNMAESGLILNEDQIAKRHLTVQGFICYKGTMARPMKTFYSEIVPLVLQGKITYREHRYNGIQESAQALCAVHTGENKGKAVIFVADG
ncbi:hypothetical protein BC835DRAFT_1411241 [Cytidiella melzeri]|nr:hypothetical protein BC835DRAFT_1411241 [Cytidiella melzeri]